VQFIFAGLFSTGANITSAGLNAQTKQISKSVPWLKTLGSASANKINLSLQCHDVPLPKSERNHEPRTGTSSARGLHRLTNYTEFSYEL
jgi:hypothetical protein